MDDEPKKTTTWQQGYATFMRDAHKPLVVLSLIGVIACALLMNRHIETIDRPYGEGELLDWYELIPHFAILTTWCLALLSIPYARRKRPEGTEPSPWAISVIIIAMIATLLANSYYYLQLKANPAYGVKFGFIEHEAISMGLGWDGATPAWWNELTPSEKAMWPYMSAKERSKVIYRKADAVARTGGTASQP